MFAKTFTKTLRGQLCIALILGAVQVFAFAPFELPWVLYPSFIGFFFLLEEIKKSTKKLFLLCFTFNFSMFVATVHWIYVSMDQFGGMPTIVNVSLIALFCSYLALFPSFALWLTFRLNFISKIMRYLLVLPVFWLLMDMFRGWFLTGFPWAYLGYSHIDTPLIGFAPIFGVQGVTLAILLLCGALTLILQQQYNKIALALIISLLLLGALLKSIRYTQLQSPINITLIQGNIDQHKKWEPGNLYTSLFKYLNLSNIKDKKQELIIWPESAIAALELEIQPALQSISADLQEKNKTLLTGIIEYNQQTKQYFNSIITLGKQPSGDSYSEKSTARYRKSHLLPIGEFVPFEKWLRPLAPYFNLPMSSFSPGHTVQPNLRYAQTNLIATLCYEITFPELLRKNIHEDTGVILTLSNDAWFDFSIGPAQHLQIARMRAIEFARPLLRSTNTGITAIYNRFGQEKGRLKAHQAGALQLKIRPAIGDTPYQSFGSLFLNIYCFIVLLLLFIRFKIKLTDIYTPIKKNKQKSKKIRNNNES